MGKVCYWRRYVDTLAGFCGFYEPGSAGHGCSMTASCSTLLLFEVVGIPSVPPFAVMEVEDGHMLELAVKLPAALPLRPPELECRRKVGGRLHTMAWCRDGAGLL